MSRRLEEGPNSGAVGRAKGTAGRRDAIELVAASVGLAGAVRLMYFVGISSIGGGWCWLDITNLGLVLAGYAIYLAQRRWEICAAGAGLWAFLALVYTWKPTGRPGEDMPWHALLPLGIALALNVWSVGTWLWRLPLPKRWVLLGTSSVILGMAIVGKPYWAAKYWGRAADLHGASLAVADLRGADLPGADLRGANLRRACLDGANLEGANLAGANLTECCLDGANLTGAKLVGTILNDALFSDSTRWPGGFDRWHCKAHERVWL